MLVAKGFTQHLHRQRFFIQYVRIQYICRRHAFTDFTLFTALKKLFTAFEKSEQALFSAPLAKTATSVAGFSATARSLAGQG
ncbi:hypothetical protein BM451_08065 [Dickeya dadantii]|nr:hypothetical protein BM451_08065 [Dickeya dadantii]